MKKITILLTGLLIAAFSSNISAQSYDVGVTSIPDPGNGALIYPNVNITTKFSIKNYGPAVPTAALDSFVIIVEVAQVDRDHYYISFDYPLGAENTYDAPAVLDFGSMGLSAGQVSLCYSTQLWSGGVNVDVDQNNDQFCIVLNYSGDSNPLKWDFAITDVKIGDALYVYNDGDTVEPIMSIYQALFTLGNTDQNAGIPTGAEFAVTVDIDGTTSAPSSFYLTVPLGPTGTIVDIPVTVSGAVPSAKTVFDACVELVASSDDTNPANDKSCSSFHVRSYVGIADEEEVQQFEMNYFNRNLSINVMNSAAGSVDLSIMSVSGQRVHSESFYSNGSDSHEVDLSKLNSGVFIAVVVTEKGTTETTRFVID